MTSQSQTTNEATFTVYQARVNRSNPDPDLLAPVAMDLTSEAAHNMAWKLTLEAHGENDIFYTARRNPQCGPVRRWYQMPWGELVPDFS